MKQPNILFLFTDDQRFDTIHALNCPDIHTPNLDRLAQRSVVFSNAYIMGGSVPAVCMPSRAMLMTGRTLFHLQQSGRWIPEDDLMMPEYFRQQDWTTFGTGKWHNGKAAYARAFGHGDRIFFGGMSDHFRVPLRHFDPTGAYPDDAIYYEEKQHSSDLFSSACIRFLREVAGNTVGISGRPFFAYVSFTAPHDPRQTHPRFHAMYDPERIPLPENFLPEHPFDNGELDVRDEKLAPWPRTPDVIRQHIADYYAMITHVDDRIGAILDTLEETGLADNTIIVFSGDNGLAVGRHGLMGKQNLYDHSVHVPLMFAGPDLPRGETRDTFAYLLDVFPTLCDLIGIDPPPSVEGRSLAPAITHDATIRDSLFFAYRGFQRAVMERRWKLIEYAVNGECTTQLFDLENDPFELRNLADDPACAEHLARLRNRLVQARREYDDELEGLGADFWPVWEKGHAG